MANKWLDNLIDLWNRLTATRAGYLDELDFDLNARLGAPAGASLAADLLTIDNLVDDLEARLTLARAGYLDNINNAQLLNITAARLGYIDLLADATVGLAALEALVDDLETAVGAIEGATTLHNKLTAARAALLDQITALRMAELDAGNLPADIDTILDALFGAVGIVTFPTPRLLPANGVSLAEVERYIAELKPHFSTPISATHTTSSADPTEDTAFTVTPIGPGLLHLTIDLAALVPGDDITFRIYQRVDGATYRLLSEQQFVGNQNLDVYQVNGIYCDVTALLQLRTLRTSGTDRSFPYRYSVFNQPVV